MYHQLEKPCIISHPAIFTPKKKPFELFLRIRWAGQPHRAAADGGRLPLAGGPGGHVWLGSVADGPAANGKTIGKPRENHGTMVV